MSSTEREEVLARSVDQARLGRSLKLGWVVSGVVFLLVVLMRSPKKIPLPAGVDLGFLPATHALLNTIVSIALVAALVAVKRGRVVWHRRWMTVALVASVLFLLGYVSYHFTHTEVRYGETGGKRTLYLTLLFSHIVAAAVSFPFILRAYILAWHNEFESHRRLVRFVYPIWLYVALTGPICYLMLRPWY